MKGGHGMHSRADDEDLLEAAEVVDEIGGDPGIEVAIGAWPLPDGEWRVKLQVRSDSPRDEHLTDSIYEHLGRLFEHGPGLDGWILRPDLGYELYGRPVAVSELDA